MLNYITAGVAQTDPAIANALNDEPIRHQSLIELIASENFVSRATLETLGHEMTNKTLEGYPDSRSYDQQVVDNVENLAKALQAHPIYQV